MLKIFNSILFGLVLLFFLALNVGAQTGLNTYEDFDWIQVAELPGSDGQSPSLGFAGMFAGTHNGALILAGGANFPEGKPWEGGRKKFWNKIYVLQKDDRGISWMEGVDLTLPKNTAYGASVSTPKGIFCLGGENEVGYHGNTWWMTWNKSKQAVGKKEGLALPQSLSNTSALYSDRYVYLFGGENQQVWNNFYRLDIETPGRSVNVIVGVLGTVFALVMATMGIPSLWDQFNMLIGLFAGGLGGIFLIGILSSSTNARGALIGLLGSAIIQVVKVPKIAEYTPLCIYRFGECHDIGLPCQ